MLCFLSYKKVPPKQKTSTSPIILEKVSVLVPLLREEEIFDRLIPRLQKIEYPTELLEFFLICEENDLVTRVAINKAKLPNQFKVFYAPTGSIETKPRALNYALPFCTGEIITIYDAEDAPESDQIYKAVRHLNSAEKHVTCVQARLDFFNQNTNWISRCFTIEYAILFRIILQGLQRLDLPIPLGGTSMFIRKSALVKLGKWDAHNVTEDADLGVRLYRAGMRVECLDSTTYEESNHRFLPWVKQRSRWLKGFFVTWLSHMRNLRLLRTELGWKGFISFNILMMGTFLTNLIVPLILPYWAVSFGLEIWQFQTIPTAFAPLMIMLLIIGEPLLLFIGYNALNTDKLRGLRWHLPCMLLYWPMASFAAYKAMFEMFFAPAYWDKTEHGIGDANFVDEINNLTNLSNLLNEEDLLQSYLSAKEIKNMR